MSVTQVYKTVQLSPEESSAVELGLIEQEWNLVKLVDHFKFADSASALNRDLANIRSALAKVRA